MNDNETSTDKNIERFAGELNERARALNHLTQGQPGLSDPAVAYTILGNLAQTSFRLAQTAEQIDHFLTRELDARRLRHDRGDDPVSAVTRAHDALAQATEQAADLGDSFRLAVGALTPIHASDPEKGALPERRAAAFPEEREEVESAKEDFPRPIGDALSGPGAAEDVSSEVRPPPQVRHPRRER